MKKEARKKMAIRYFVFLHDYTYSVIYLESVLSMKGGLTGFAGFQRVWRVG